MSVAAADDIPASVTATMAFEHLFCAVGHGLIDIFEFFKAGGYGYYVVFLIGGKDAVSDDIEIERFSFDID